MSRKLTFEEKQSLLTILKVFYGTDKQFLQYKYLFNEQTIEVTAEALEQLQRCNNQLFTLMSGLIGGGAVLAKGKFREILKEVADALSDNKDRYNLVACRNDIAIKYKTKILSTIF